MNTLLRDAQSRRRFLRSLSIGSAGGSAVLLAACGSSSRGSSSAPTGTGASGGGGDVALLNLVLDLENMAIAAYTAGAPLLSGKVITLAKELLSQEKAHAKRLSQAIKQLGGAPNPPSAIYNFPKLSSQSDVLKLASQIENTAIAAYIDAIPKLSSSDLRATGASIVTDEAEHLSVLQSALGRDPVPTAFVVGRSA